MTSVRLLIVYNPYCTDLNQLFMMNRIYNKRVPHWCWAGFQLSVLTEVLALSVSLDINVSGNAGKYLGIRDIFGNSTR